MRGPALPLLSGVPPHPRGWHGKAGRSLMSKVQKTASAQPCTCAPVGTAPPKRQGGAGRREEMSRGAAPSLRMPRAQTPAPDSDT